MTDLFNQADDQPVVDPNKDYFSELVGDDKKFKTPQDLARAKAESDAFIARLTRENAGLREDLSKRTTVEQFVDLLNKPEGTPTTSNSNNQQGESGEQGRSLSAEDIEKIVEDRLKNREAARTHSQNIEKVKTELSSILGSDFVNRLDEITKSIGLPREEANRLAATAPDALINMVKAAAGAKQSTPDLFTPPKGQNLSSFAPNTSERNEKYYKELRAKDPATYWSPKVQKQEMDDAIRLGAAFFT